MFGSSLQNVQTSMVGGKGEGERERDTDPFLTSLSPPRVEAQLPLFEGLLENVWTFCGDFTE